MNLSFFPYIMDYYFPCLIQYYGTLIDDFLVFNIFIVTFPDILLIVNYLDYVQELR